MSFIWRFFFVCIHQVGKHLYIYLFLISQLRNSSSEKNKKYTFTYNAIKKKEENKKKNEERSDIVHEGVLTYYADCLFGDLLIQLNCLLLSNE